MSVALVISAEAQIDIAEALTWLANVSPSLPGRFEVELEQAYTAIGERPNLYPLVSSRVRRAVLHRFPYSVVYAVRSHAIIVIGVIHQARHESTWKRRF